MFSSAEALENGQRSFPQLAGSLVLSALLQDRAQILDDPGVLECVLAVERQSRGFLEESDGFIQFASRPADARAHDSRFGA